MHISHLTANSNPQARKKQASSGDCEKHTCLGKHIRLEADMKKADMQRKKQCSCISPPITRRVNPLPSHPNQQCKAF